MEPSQLTGAEHFRVARLHGVFVGVAIEGGALGWASRGYSISPIYIVCAA